MLPSLEPAVLAVVAIGSKEHLWLDKDNPIVDNEDAAVVAHIAMHDGHANVTENIFAA